MRSDPRVIRWTMLKLGEKIEDVVQDPEMTVDRSGQRGTGPNDSLKFLGSSAEPRLGFGEGIGLGITEP